MGVNRKHADYVANEKKWERCRDCYDGTDAVKKRATIYLPYLDSHKEGGSDGFEGYNAYILRALFYNATGRTVEGLAGYVFQKPVEVKAPSGMKEDWEDVTLTGVDINLFTMRALQETLVTGRNGVLIDLPENGGDDSRPYWISFRAEDIYSWRSERIEGDPQVLTRVVLREFVEEPDPNDLEFGLEGVERFRVLELHKVGEKYEYSQRVYRKIKNSDKFSAGSPVWPERHGKRLSRIPFVFVSSLGMTTAVGKPPLLDMVDVNLSHYRTMADLEHGRHFTALPTPWISGIRQSETPLKMGAGAWDLDKGGSAGMLEFTGAGLNALVKAEQDKRKMMGVLGARLLEEQTVVERETATAVRMRHSGEGATLKAIVEILEKALSRVIQWHVWWTSTEESVKDVNASLDINREFFTVQMDANTLAIQLQLLQADAISFETFFYNITKGGFTRPGITPKQEQEAISRGGGFSQPLLLDEDDDRGIPAPPASEEPPPTKEEPVEEE